MVLASSNLTVAPGLSSAVSITPVLVDAAIFDAEVDRAKSVTSLELKKDKPAGISSAAAPERALSPSSPKATMVPLAPEFTSSSLSGISWAERSIEIATSVMVGSCERVATSCAFMSERSDKLATSARALRSTSATSS